MTYKIKQTKEVNREEFSECLRSSITDKLESYDSMPIEDLVLCESDILEISDFVDALTDAIKDHKRSETLEDHEEWKADNARMEK